VFTRAHMRSPFAPQALRGALAGIGVVLAAAGLGGAVRLLPWLLDRAVTTRLALPFARGLFLLAAEAALLVGWPVGWSLAAAGLVERGEARVLSTLGESPYRTLARLWPQTCAFACALGLVSFLGGREASEPGRVVTDLIGRGRESCGAVTEDSTYAVPFAGVTWLCAPGRAPRLVGHGPGRLSSASFTATSARASGDLRELELADVDLALGWARVHAGAVRIAGLSPFGHASDVPPAARAFSLSIAGALAAGASVLAMLRGSGRGRAAALVLAASGSLAALAAMRWIDRSAWAWPLALLAPTVAICAVALTSAVFSRLPRVRWTASK